MKAIFILITTVIIGTIDTQDNHNLINYDDNCDFELSVENNKSIKSTRETGAKFYLTLKNKSSNTSTYSLLSNNLDTPCGNKDLKKSGVNVSLNVTFKNELSRLEENEITLRSGESKRFMVYVTVPDGTKFNKWGCIEIEVNPKGCSSNSAKTVLSVYVPGISKN
jgi:hypothetical protein